MNGISYPLVPLNFTASATLYSSNEDGEHILLTEFL